MSKLNEDLPTEGYWRLLNSDEYVEHGDEFLEVWPGRPVRWCKIPDDMKEHDLLRVDDRAWATNVFRRWVPGVDVA